jgi:hypothetical protein
MIPSIGGVNVLRQARPFDRLRVRVVYGSLIVSRAEGPCRTTVNTLSSNRRALPHGGCQRTFIEIIEFAANRHTMGQFGYDYAVG